MFLEDVILQPNKKYIRFTHTCTHHSTRSVKCDKKKRKRIKYTNIQNPSQIFACNLSEISLKMQIEKTIYTISNFIDYILLKIDYFQIRMSNCKLNFTSNHIISFQIK